MRNVSSELLESKIDGPSNEIIGVYLINHPRIKNYVFRIKEGNSDTEDKL